MNATLVFVAVIALAGVFAILVGVITLRFLNVLQQMKRADSMDRSELLREIDASHVAAFTNAMSALRDVQERVAESNMAMFSRTMDMVHGPIHDDGREMAVDEPSMDMRAPWAPTDDDDMTGYMIDPTDDDPDLSIMLGQEPHAISVRPGETLIPNG